MDLKLMIFLYAFAFCTITAITTENPLTTSKADYPETTSQNSSGKTSTISTTFDATGQNCLQVVEGLTELSSFLKHLKNAGLTGHLTGKDQLTIFAPTNEAFNSMDYRAKNIFGKEKEKVLAAMSYHLSNGKIILSSDMHNEQLLDTLNEGKKIIINVYPNEKIKNKNLYTATGAEITNPDIVASNCVIHEIKKVILKFPEDNLFDTLSKISKFKTFYETLLKNEDLKKLLSTQGNYTVFAPIQQAFTKKAAKELISISDVLKNHIVAGTYWTPSFRGEPELTSIQGSKLFIHYKKSIIADMILVNESTLFETDIPFTYGVIHAINKVIDFEKE